MKKQKTTIFLNKDLHHCIGTYPGAGVQGGQHHRGGEGAGGGVRMHCRLLGKGGTKSVKMGINFRQNQIK